MLGISNKPGAFGKRDAAIAQQAKYTIREWRIVTEMMKARTHCYPDVILLKYSRAADKVLGLLDEFNVIPKSFETLRKTIISTIIQQGRANPYLLLKSYILSSPKYQEIMQMVEEQADDEKYEVITEIIVKDSKYFIAGAEEFDEEFDEEYSPNDPILENAINGRKKAEQALLEELFKMNPVRNVTEVKAKKPHKGIASTLTQISTPHDMSYMDGW
jgi:hypothetical protein